jgi:hypothetical protein
MLLLFRGNVIFWVYTPSQRRPPVAPLARGDSRAPRAERQSVRVARSKAERGKARPGHGAQDEAGWRFESSWGQRPREGRLGRLRRGTDDTAEFQ